MKVSIPSCFQSGKAGLNVIASFWSTPRLDCMSKSTSSWMIKTYEKVQIAYWASIQLPSLLYMITPLSLYDMFVTTVFSMSLVSFDVKKVDASPMMKALKPR